MPSTLNLSVLTEMMKGAKIQQNGVLAQAGAKVEGNIGEELLSTFLYQTGGGYKNAKEEFLEALEQKYGKKLVARVRQNHLANSKLSNPTLRDAVEVIHMMDGSVSQKKISKGRYILSPDQTNLLERALIYSVLGREAPQIDKSQKNAWRPVVDQDGSVSAQSLQKALEAFILACGSPKQRVTHAWLKEQMIQKLGQKSYEFAYKEGEYGADVSQVKGPASLAPRSMNPDFLKPDNPSSSARHRRQQSPFYRSALEYAEYEPSGGVRYPYSHASAPFPGSPNVLYQTPGKERRQSQFFPLQSAPVFSSSYPTQVSFPPSVQQKSTILEEEDDEEDEAFYRQFDKERPLSPSSNPISLLAYTDGSTTDNEEEGYDMDGTTEGMTSDTDLGRPLSSLSQPGFDHLEDFGSPPPLEGVVKDDEDLHV